MHPILSNRERLFIYLLGWLALALLLTITMAAGRFAWTDAALLVIPLAAIAAFFSLSSWYLCRAFPVRDTPTLRLFGAHLVGAFFFSGALLLLTQGWSFVLVTAGNVPVALDPGDLRLIFGAGVLLYLLVASVHYLLAAFEASRDADRRSFESQLLARDSELKALRAQIDPHFLFNSLNSISALIAVDAAAARAMTVQLAEFFRTSVAAGRRDLITLAEEAELVHRYLEIERVRFGDRLQLVVSIDADARTCHIPPLILQPLAENAVKHGIAQLVQGGTVTVSAGKTSNTLHISMTNPYESTDRTRRPGASFGLNAVRERLRAVAGNDGRIDIRTKDGFFTVDVFLPATL